MLLQDIRTHKQDEEVSHVQYSEVAFDLPFDRHLA